MAVTQDIKPNKAFPPQVACGHDLFLSDLLLICILCALTGAVSACMSAEGVEFFGTGVTVVSYDIGPGSWTQRS